MLERTLVLFIILVAVTALVIVVFYIRYRMSSDEGRAISFAKGTFLTVHAALLISGSTLTIVGARHVQQQVTGETGNALLILLLSLTLVLLGLLFTIWVSRNLGLLLSDKIVRAVLE